MDEPTPPQKKYKTSPEQRAAAKRYYDEHKHDPEYKKKRAAREARWRKETPTEHHKQKMKALVKAWNEAHKDPESTSAKNAERTALRRFHQLYHAGDEEKLQLEYFHREMTALHRARARMYALNSLRKPTNVQEIDLADG